MTYDSNQNQRESQIFLEVVKIADSEERIRRLRELCGNDRELRKRVEDLLSPVGDPTIAMGENTLPLEEETIAWSQGESPVEISGEASTEDVRLKPEKPPITELSAEKREEILFGDYVLQGEIARGAMGIVYRAEHKRLKRSVAMKMIRSTVLANDEEIARFIVEAEAAASLDHPNIVPIYEIGEIDGQHYFTMKLVEGGTLRDRIDALYDEPDESARLIAKVARAIHVAHQRQILHRDIKPGNILMDEEEEPHVTDFGLAKDMAGGSSMTMSGQIMGTPNYMAPEQAEGGSAHLTTAADIYALGAVFYELLTKRTPHRGDSVMETLRLVSEEEPRTISVHRRNVNQDLETIAMKCLARDPERRYVSAAALAEDLEAWLRGEPIQARPVGNVERALKWVKRKPVHALAAGVAILFFLTLGIGGPIAAIKQSELRIQAEEAEAEARLSRYASDMFLADQALTQGNLALARQTLEANVPDHGQLDVRDVAWRNLWARSHRERGKEVPGSPSVVCMDFSADGSLLAMGGRVYSSLNLWTFDEESGSLTSLGSEHSYQDVLQIAVSASGTRVFASAAGKARLFTRTGNTLALDHVFEGRTYARAAFLEDQDLLFLASGAGYEGSGKGTLECWRLSPLEKIQTLENAGGRLALSDDGKILVTGKGPENAIHFWDTETLNHVGEYRTDNLILALAVSPDGSTMATNGGNPGKVEIISIPEGKRLAVLKGHRAKVESLDFSHDGTLLASGSKDQTVRLWSTDLYDEIEMLTGHDGEVRTLTFSGNDQYLFSGSSRGNVLQWPVSPAPNHRSVEMRGWPSETWYQFAFRISSDHRYLAYRSATKGRALTFADIDTLESLAEIELPDSEPIGFDPLNSESFYICTGNTLEKLSFLTGTKTRVCTIPADRIFLNEAIRISPNGKYLAARSETEERAMVLELSSGRELAHMTSGYPGFCTSLGFSPLGDLLFTCGLGTREGMHIWNIPSGDRFASYSSDFSIQNSKSAAFSPTRNLIAWGMNVGDIEVRNLETGELVNRLAGHTEKVNSLSFTSDGRVLISGSEDGWVKFWHTHTWRELASIGHPVSVDYANVIKDQSILVTALNGHREIRFQAIPGFEEIESRIVTPLSALKPPATRPTASDDSTIPLFPVAHGSPFSPETTTPVDLSPFYNGKLKEEWTSADGKGPNNLARLPRGDQVGNNISWTLGGLIQLSSRLLENGARSFPEKVEAIPINRNCQHIHFLHGVSHGSNSDGAVAGHYSIHYEDGSTEVIPLFVGEAFRDWWVKTDVRIEVNASIARSVWIGKNEARDSTGGHLALYTFSWENPHPEKKVISIDFSSTMGKAAPFLLSVSTD